FSADRPPSSRIRRTQSIALSRGAARGLTTNGSAAAGAIRPPELAGPDPICAAPSSAATSLTDFPPNTRRLDALLRIAYRARRGGHNADGAYTRCKARVRPPRPCSCGRRARARPAILLATVSGDSAVPASGRTRRGRCRAQEGPHAELSEEDLGDAVERVVHGLQLRGRFGERNADDLVAAERGHPSPFLLRHHVRRMDAEARAQHPVERGRRAAALDVP